LIQNLETVPGPGRLALSIVIPVYNGASSIADLVGALEKLSIAGGHEIVLVNDGSADDSLAVCHALFDKARVPMTIISLTRNYGEHNAVMAGLRYANGLHVITMDDDLQNPPEEVARLLAFAQRNGSEVIYTYYDDKRHPVWRNIASSFANRIADFILDKPRGFYLSSFRCMTAFVAREVIRYEGPFPYIDGLILQVTHDGASTLAAMVEYVCQLFRNAPAGQHGNGLRVERARSGWSSDGGWRSAVIVPTAGLGIANGGGFAALGSAIVDPRHHWGIPRPTVSYRQPETSISGERSAAYRAS
jgi:glycosyltransferase involved in cell wall biosynthesis